MLSNGRRGCEQGSYLTAKNPLLRLLHALVCTNPAQSGIERAPDTTHTHTHQSQALSTFCTAQVPEQARYLMGCEVSDDTQPAQATHRAPGLDTPPSCIAIPPLSSFNVLFLNFPHSRENRRMIVHVVQQHRCLLSLTSLRALPPVLAWSARAGRGHSDAGASLQL